MRYDYFTYLINLMRSYFGLLLLVGSSDHFLHHVPHLLGDLSQPVELAGQRSELATVESHGLLCGES